MPEGREPRSRTSLCRRDQVTHLASIFSAFSPPCSTSAQTAASPRWLSPLRGCETPSGGAVVPYQHGRHVTARHGTARLVVPQQGRWQQTFGRLPAPTAPCQRWAASVHLSREFASFIFSFKGIASPWPRKQLTGPAAGQIPEEEQGTGLQWGQAVAHQDLDLAQRTGNPLPSPLLAQGPGAGAPWG